MIRAALEAMALLAFAAAISVWGTILGTLMGVGASVIP